ncbi:DUF523 and DUF1722 domain-containing protein [Candidatus Fermentibacteria bacterium]|nr:DUF523 and DUF1722 domain-containing protein [Candidatus Fermentibacteria bacterium]
MDDKIRIGISTCLLGRDVRFDGGHKHDPFLTETLGEYVEYVPVCPEVECGLSIPREAMRLVGNPAAPRLLTIKTKVDHTDRMETWARRRLDELEHEGLCGFIFKSKSPSSGMERVKVYDDNGVPSKNGVGVFARMFMARFPLIPVEEEGRLHDPGLRENFIETIFALRRWCAARACERGLRCLVEFHTREKLLLLAHSPVHYRALGKLVAGGTALPLDELYEAYERDFVSALRLRPTVRKHVNVLMHIMGYFKRDLSPDEKQELLEIIGLYKDGSAPLIVPVTLLNHYVRKYDQQYLRGQTYLNPHPVALKLRTHA